MPPLSALCKAFLPLPMRRKTNKSGGNLFRRTYFYMSCRSKTAGCNFAPMLRRLFHSSDDAVPRRNAYGLEIGRKYFVFIFCTRRLPYIPNGFGVEILVIAVGISTETDTESELGAIIAPVVPLHCINTVEFLQLFPNPSRAGSLFCKIGLAVRR